MFDDRILRRHRLSGLANGVLIGMGIVGLMAGNAKGYGIILVAVGVGIEIWQRSRIPKG